MVIGVQSHAFDKELPPITSLSEIEHSTDKVNPLSSYEDLSRAATDGRQLKSIKLLLEADKQTIAARRWQIQRAKEAHLNDIAQYLEQALSKDLIKLKRAYTQFFAAYLVKMQANWFVDHVKLRIEILKDFLDFDVDLEFKFSQYYAQFGNKDVSDKENWSSSDWVTYERFTPIYWAAKHHDIELLKLLINQKANPNVVSSHTKTTPLNVGVRNYEVTLLLLNAGANPRNTKSENSPISSLLIAAIEDSKAAMRSKESHFIPILELLLSKNAEVSEQDIGLAQIYSFHEIVKRLNEARQRAK